MYSDLLAIYRPLFLVPKLCHPPTLSTSLLSMLITLSHHSHLFNHPPNYHVVLRRLNINSLCSFLFGVVPLANSKFDRPRMNLSDRASVAPGKLQTPVLGSGKEKSLGTYLSTSVPQEPGDVDRTRSDAVSRE